MEKDCYERALALREETVAHRRYLHENAEVGLELPKACAYIQKVLGDCGIEAKPCGHGLVAEVGKGKRTVLLRADMDALPMREDSGELFAAKGSAAHTCGHDLHAAMLLSAAKILKEREESLSARVRFMFQPAEEELVGCRDMMENGLLAEKPSCAFALHVGAGRLPVGQILYNAGGVMMLSCNRFRIELVGKGGHAAYPQLARDPLAVAVKLYTALESLIVKEKAPERCAVLSIGRIVAGEADNVISESAILEGSLRTDDKELQAHLVGRIQALAEGYAALYGVSVNLLWKANVPPLVCDEVLTERVVGSLKREGLTFVPAVKASASEDFALIASEVPSTYLYLSAGFDDARGDYPAHNPKVVFDERVLPLGSAIYAHCALQNFDDL